ncbi:MAG TPA: RNA polymerase sigma factor [Nocardioides sp.]|jgi:RNA polymerase sigma-70 factor (ECF subfamily)|nr:RNA polymerase sigma factor [Nocardioides sp.]
MTEVISGDDLVSRARAGDPAAWRELYTSHAGRLVRWLDSMPSRDAAADAEDIAAEAWLTAAQKIATFSGSSSDFPGWLFGIARNASLNTRRRSDRRATSPHAVDPDHAHTWGIIDDASAQVAGADLTRRLLSHLPPREAEVVASLDVVGLDVASTAKALGISTTAVRVARHRGLGRLRKLLPAEGAVPRVTAPVRRSQVSQA